MYKKKKRTPIYLAVAALIVLIAILLLFHLLISRRSARIREEETETETEFVTESDSEIQKHNILLYKPSAGTIEFDSSWLVSDGEKEAELLVEDNTLVTIMISPVSGKILDTVDVLDYDMRTVDFVLRSASGSDFDAGREMRLSFVMPDRDVFINFNFADMIPTNNLYESEREEDSEAETSATSPYGLTLHGLTADIITSFNGMFDERKFLQALGDALHIDSVRSEYRTVTDVYFGRMEECDLDKVSYHIYFNKDELWEVLATYYTNEDSYIFTQPSQNTETEISVQTDAQISGSSGNSPVTGTADSGVGTAGSYGNMYSTQESATTTTTSLDILSVSTVFLAYVKDEEAFYQAAFDYIMEKGCTGHIVGTMSGYEIEPEKKTATINIMLSTGATITGTYNKAKNTYSFSGL